MKHHLTCDEVFDHLTRAPFPTGEASDQFVDEHLRVCHECRQMAEALRPATNLFREAMADDQRRQLPSYQGQLATMIRSSNVESTVDSAASKFTAWNPVVVDRTSRHQPWYLLPALGMTLLLMAAMLQGRGIVGDRSSEDLPIAKAETETEMTCVMAGFALPSDCLPQPIVGPTRPQPVKPPQQPIGNRDHMRACLQCHESVRSAAADVCCTTCHAANAEKSTDEQRHATVFPRLATSCTQCHDVKQRG